MRPRRPCAGLVGHSRVYCHFSKQAVDLRLQAVVESFAEAGRKLEHPFVCRKDQDVPSGIENGGAYLAVLKMPLHQCPDVLKERIVEEIGDAAPNILAVDHHGSNLRLGCNRFSCGARRFCINILAR